MLCAGASASAVLPNHALATCNDDSGVSLHDDACQSPATQSPGAAPMTSSAPVVGEERAVLQCDQTYPGCFQWTCGVNMDRVEMYGPAMYNHAPLLRPVLASTPVAPPVLEVADCGVYAGSPQHTRAPYRGQLRLHVYVNSGLLTVHIMESRHLWTACGLESNAYVKVALVPDDTKRSTCKTRVLKDSACPAFHEKFSFELMEGDMRRRCFISTWHKETNHSASELLGCMSFGVKHVVQQKTIAEGWYYLLPEAMGRKKHLHVNIYKQRTPSSGTQSDGSKPENAHPSSTNPARQIPTRATQTASAGPVPQPLISSSNLIPDLIRSSAPSHVHARKTLEANPDYLSVDNTTLHTGTTNAQTTSNSTSFGTRLPAQLTSAPVHLYPDCNNLGNAKQDSIINHKSVSSGTMTSVGTQALPEHVSILRKLHSANHGLAVPPYGSATSSPFSPPYSSPFSPPVSSPLSQPASTPFSPSASSPFSPPASAPFSPPVSSPFSPQTSSPFSPPASAPFSPPVSSPFSPQTSSPFSPPASAPFSPPVSSPFSPQTSSPFSPPASSPFSPPGNVSSNQYQLSTYGSTVTSPNVISAACMTSSWRTSLNSSQSRSSSDHGYVSSPRQVTIPQSSDPRDPLYGRGFDPLAVAELNVTMSRSVTDSRYGAPQSNAAGLSHVRTPGRDCPAVTTMASGSSKALFNGINPAAPRVSAATNGPVQPSIAAAPQHSQPQRLQLQIRRAPGGFGLLLTDERPVRVMRIKPGSPAEVAGLRHHDVILRIDEHDVTKLSADTVARVLRQCEASVQMQVERHSTPSYLPAARPHDVQPTSTSQFIRDPPTTRDLPRHTTTNQTDMAAPIRTESNPMAVSVSVSHGLNQPVATASNQPVQPAFTASTNSQRVQSAHGIDRKPDELNSFKPVSRSTDRNSGNIDRYSHDKEGLRTASVPISAPTQGPCNNSVLIHEQHYVMPRGLQNGAFLKTQPPSYENVYDMNQSERNQSRDHNYSVLRDSDKKENQHSTHSLVNEKKLVNEINGKEHSAHLLSAPQPFQHRHNAAGHVQHGERTCIPGVRSEAEPLRYVSPPPYPRPTPAMRARGEQGTAEGVSDNFKGATEQQCMTLAADRIDHIYTSGVPRKPYTPVSIAMHMHHQPDKTLLTHGQHLNNVADQGKEVVESSAHVYAANQQHIQVNNQLQSCGHVHSHGENRDSCVDNQNKQNWDPGTRNVRVSDNSRKHLPGHDLSSQHKPFVSQRDENQVRGHTGFTENKAEVCDRVDPMKQLLQKIQNVQTSHSYVLATEF